MVPCVPLHDDIWLSFVQSAGDVATLRCVLRGISALLTRIHLSPQAVREFPSQHLPSLFSPLLGFAHGDPELQCVTLPVISKLLLLNPRAGAQFRVRTLGGVFARSDYIILPICFDSFRSL